MYDNIADQLMATFLLQVVYLVYVPDVEWPVLILCALYLQKCPNQVTLTINSCSFDSLKTRRFLLYIPPPGLLVRNSGKFGKFLLTKWSQLFFHEVIVVYWVSQKNARRLIWCNYYCQYPLTMTINLMILIN